MTEGKTFFLHKDDFRSTNDGYHLDVWNELTADLPALKDGRRILELEVKVISCYSE